MTQDKTDPLTSISQVNSRVVPVRNVQSKKTASLEPRLGQLRRAFASLVAASEDPPLQQRLEFDITGAGKIRTGTLRDFNLADEENESGKGFIVTFEYSGHHPLTHLTSSEHAHKAVRKLLFRHGLDFRSSGSDVAFKIEVQPKIPAYVMVLADNDGKTISVTLHNIGMFGASTFKFLPDQIDRKLIDALIELVSTGGRQFYEITAALPRRRV